MYTIYFALTGLLGSQDLKLLRELCHLLGCDLSLWLININNNGFPHKFVKFIRLPSVDGRVPVKLLLFKKLHIN